MFNRNTLQALVGHQDRGSAAFRARLFYFGAMTIFLLTVTQVIIGGDAGTLVIAAVTGLIVWGFLSLAPYRLGHVFALYVFFQMLGFALIYKTLLWTPFESGLLRPLASMGWGLAAVVLTCLAILLSRIGNRTPPVLNRFYGNPENWTRLGVALLCIGEGASYGGYLINKIFTTNYIGVFDPLKTFTLAGICLLASSAVRSGRLINVPLAVALVFGIIDALLFNQKGEMIFRVGAWLATGVLGPLPRSRKLLLGGVVAVSLLLGNALLFPAIHTMRSGEIRDKSMQDRVGMVRAALSSGAAVDLGDVRDIQGNIWHENLRFMPSSGWFALRFASLGYLDLTLEFAEAGNSRMTFPDFVRRVVNQSLPRGFSGEKDYYQLADLLWYDIDRRMVPGGNTTMGALASARLIFGEAEGMLVFLLGLTIVMWLYRRFYGDDIRSPLALYVLAAVFYPLVDGDIEQLYIVIVRIFWQTLLIFWVAGALLSRGKAQLPGLPDAGKAIPGR